MHFYVGCTHLSLSTVCVQELTARSAQQELQHTSAGRESLLIYKLFAIYAIKQFHTLKSLMC